MAADTPFSLDGRVAVVTGASRGLGRGLAHALAQSGADVAAMARHEEALRELSTEITALGRRCAVIAVDVSDVGSIERGFARAKEELGSIDILVANAGLGANHPAESVTESDWDSMMAVNLRGLFFCNQAAGRMMLEQGNGAIVNISSQAGLVGIRDHVVYSASKGGVNMLTKVLALEWSSRGVTVNAVAPTFVYTPGTAERLDQPEYLAAVLDRIPIGRVATIDDVANAVIFLASDAGAMITGQILAVDGGWTAQ